MMTFVIGVVVGTFVGVFAVGICRMGVRADEAEDRR
jgi:hypothetical protein